MRYLFVFLFFLTGCAGLQIPSDFKYYDIKTDFFTIASWQKITTDDGVIKVYIEGDGHAFNRLGRPTSDPTPHGTLVRDLAFADTSENVVYLARPCQFIQGGGCDKKYWTTARFSQEVIQSEYIAIKKIAGSRPVVLIGYSGGAQVAGLLATTTNLNIKKVITLAGNLDFNTWTSEFNMPPLSESLALENYKKDFMKISQIHYVGEFDKIIPMKITTDFVGSENVVVVPGADHSKGFEVIYTKIWNEN
ncbi:MAG: hypothetical protein LBL75_00685 [Rickettsiales bacterium]|jgi:hypothetical protein|nr:hypothetical protein [Rickettsiales bacterium]